MVYSNGVSGKNVRQPGAALFLALSYHVPKRKQFSVAPTWAVATAAEAKPIYGRVFFFTYGQTIAGSLLRNP